MNNPDVIIVGAGITGLATADLLQSHGRRVMILEASDRIGGRMVRMTRGDDMVDVGTQGIFTNFPEVMSLANRLGLADKLIPLQQTVRYLDGQGQPRESSGNADMLKILGARGAADLVAFNLKYFTRAKKLTLGEINRDIPKYDNVSAADALSWAGKDFNDYVLRPMLHMAAGARTEDVSLYYTVSMLRLRMTGTYSYLPTGIVTLAERLASSLPITLETPVVSLLTNGSRVEGVQLADGRAIKAPHVILATTVDAAARIIPDEFRPAQQFLREFHHSPLPMPILFLDRPLESQAYSYIGHPYRDAVFNIALNHARKSPEMVPSGKAILSAWPALSGASMDLANAPESEIVAMALRDLDAFIPGVASMVEEARLMRHAWGIARYAPGDYRKVLDFKKYAEGIAGLSFAGTDYDGVVLEGSVRSAQRAVARALAA
jgi:protoporphyrinogen oxidase